MLRQDYQLMRKARNIQQKRDEEKKLRQDHIQKERQELFEKKREESIKKARMF